MINDELFFKAAGREWASSGHFAAPEVTGYSDSVPATEEIFAQYPPLYSFLFGLFVKVLGFSWRTVFLYDGLLHVLLCFITIRIARTIAPDAGGWRAYAAGLAVLPIATVGRPDELAMCIGMVACGLALAPAPSRLRNLASGGLLGLCCATSVGAAFAFACIWALLSAHSLRESSVSIALARITEATFSGIVVLTLCLLPILATHPTAYAWFVADMQSTAAARPLIETWEQSGRLAGFLLVAVAGVVMSALLLMVASRGRPRMDGWRPLLGAVLSTGCMVYIARGKYTYLWFTTPWLLAAVLSIAGTSRFGASSWARRLATQISLLAMLAGAIPYAHSSLVLLTLPREQSLAFNIVRLQALMPPGTVAMGDIAWLAVAGRDRVYDTEFASAGVENLARTDFVVLTGNGTGRPGLRWRLSPDQEAYLARHFIVLENRLPRSPLVLGGGWRVSNSAYGFGSIVYVRKDRR